jgi:ankyrin repeat protein
MGCDINAQDNNSNTPLHDALRDFDPNKGGDVTVWAYLINQKGVNGDITGQYGDTILHRACMNINNLPLDVFKLLIETVGCDVNAQNNKDIPLHNALRSFNQNKGGDISVLQYLFSQMSTNGYNGNTILHYACEKIDKIPLGVFKLLIETMGYDVNVQNNDKDTPLHNAFRYFKPSDGGNIAVLTYLLSQKDINGNVKGKDGDTLLHIACKCINRLPLDIFKILIETHGGDVNVRDVSGKTPLFDVMRSSSPYGNNIDIFIYLLTQKNVDVNIKGQKGDTLLHYACEKIHDLPLDVFKCLIETLGCDVNIQNNNKNTPLHYALQSFNPYNNPDITVLTYLIDQKNVNVNIKGKHGSTLLHLACKEIDNLPLDVFKFLIETMGCDVNVQDDEKNTPLHNALENFDPYNDEHSEDDGIRIFTVLTYLLSQMKVNADIKGKDGYSLLHTACEKINILSLEIFKVLIEKHGCDVNAHNDNNDAPLDDALRYFDPYYGGDINVLVYLINQTNIGVNTKYTEGFTLLHSACTINPSTTWDPAKQNAECDAISCQIVEAIAERCIQEVLDETTPFEATTTM